MASPLLSQPLSGGQERLELVPEERERLEKRRKAVRDYDPPKWTSNDNDAVSGSRVEVQMVAHASILS